MFKIICLILVSFFIQTYTLKLNKLKCFVCDKKPETEDKRQDPTDITDGNCKDKNDNGTMTECAEKKTFCLFAYDGKDTCKYITILCFTHKILN